MLDLISISAALALGQGPPGGAGAVPGPDWPPFDARPPALSAPAPPSPPAWSLTPPPPAPATSAADSRVVRTALQQPEPELPKAQELTAPILPKPDLPAEAETPAEEPALAADRWFLMRELQGTWLGMGLDDHRTSVSGWIEGSYTASTAELSNVPMVWNDRANNFLLQQAWLRLERSVVTSGTTSPSFGYRVDVLSGSDYRFSLPRGIFNSQLINTKPGNLQDRQNLYGVDPIQFYGNMYIPNLFQGTDIRAGRLYTPFGYESLEGISTPLLSRSYAFNWCPPFTHMGVMASITFSPQWSGKFMLANGNDVFLDPSQEARFVGSLTWLSVDKRDSVTFGTSVGRGKFNSGDPFAPQTSALMSEDVGRNNINVFDLVWTHVLTSKLGYAVEVIYGYQTGVPTTALINAQAAAAGTTPDVVGAIVKDNATNGTAHWGSVCQYLNYSFTDKLGGILRFELFDDFEGQRTGFEGLYTAVTTGLQFRPRKDIIIRPELRYDYNGYSKPFNLGTRHDLFTASTDFIIRY